MQLQLDRPVPGERTTEAAPSNGIAAVLADLIKSLDVVMARDRPSLVLVQGDTTSSVAAAFAAFAQRIPIAHVEAGLRTFDLAKPFPEEAWRATISQIADFHFAPTRRAAKNLRTVGVKANRIWITGNTVVDALRSLAGSTEKASTVARERLVLVTLHRRENWQAAFDNVCSALIRLRDQVHDIQITFVGHANPVLRAAAESRLANQERIRVVAPLDYPDFIKALRASTLVLSDSGGVQEEAPTFGVPVLILRDSTERPEAVEAGVAKIVGTNTNRIVRTARRLLTNARVYARMSGKRNPFGDGRASERIAMQVSRQLKRRGRDKLRWFRWP